MGHQDSGHLLRKSLRVRLMAGTMAVFLPVAVVAVVAVSVLRSTTDTVTTVSREQAAVSEPLQHLEGQLHEAALPVERYTVGGRADARADALRSFGDVDALFARLDVHSLASTERRAVATARQAWKRARALGGSLLDAPTIIGNVGSVGTHERFDTAIVEAVAGLHRAHHALDSRHAAAARAARRHDRDVTLMLVVAFIVAVATAHFSARALSRSIIRPMDALRRSAGRLSRGDLTHRVALANRDEFGSLATDLNGMAAAIEERENRLTHHAYHDPLTGLPNRRLFTDRLEHALARGVRSRRELAVLFLDLDNFKSVNDGFGHPTGDMLLRTVAQRVQTHARAGDTVARFGGDEFAVLLEDVGEAEAVAYAERLCSSLSDPIQLAETELRVAASVGIAVRAGPGDAEDLLRDADIAMYAAKAQPGVRYRIFEPSMHSAVLEQLQLGADLRRALDRGELQLRFQPVVELAGGRIAGFEALLRWQHSERGLLAPDAFLPLAEETGLIIPIGEWVLYEACRWARRWQIAFPSVPPRYVAVNVSARQLDASDLAATVAAVLATTELDPTVLVLEVTETVLMEDPDAASAVLRALRALGVRVAIDDFGTGYSSLGYLQRLPVDVLKIDKTFVDGLARSGEDASLVRNILALAEDLDLHVVAEGIEDPAQAAVLGDMGCGFGQGYHFARPLAPSDAEQLLAQGSTTDPVAATSDAGGVPTSSGR